MRGFPVWGWMLPLLLAAAGLGARGLNIDAIWFDERWTLFVAGGGAFGPLSPVEIVARLVETDPNHVPVYALLVAPWGAAVGWYHIPALRVLSLFIGMLAISMTYRMGRDLFDARVGLIAALVVGLAAYFIFYLHELRNYTLTVLLASSMIWLYWRLQAQGRTPRPYSYALFTLLTTVSLYTTYLALGWLVPMGLYHLLFVPKNRRWWAISTAAVGGVLPFLLWTPVLFDLVGRTAQAGGKGNIALGWLILPHFVYAASNGTIALLLPPLLALRRQHDPAVRYLTLLLVFGLVALLVVDSQLKIISNMRYGLYLWPVVGVLFAVGLLNGRGRRLLVIACAAWVLSGVWNTFTPAFSDALGGQLGGYSLNRLFRLYLPFQTFVTLVEREAQPDDLVTFHLPDHQWMFRDAYDYYRPLLPANNFILEDLPFNPDVPDDYTAQVRRRLNTAARAWVGVEKYFPSTSKLDDLLRVLADEGFMSCGRRYDDAEMSLDLYARDTACCQAHPPPNDAPRLGNVRLNLLNTPAVQDGTIPVLLSVWGDPALDAATYSLGLHVSGADGLPQAQLDVPLTGAAYSCRMLPIPASDLEAGSYRLRAAIYDWTTGQRLPGADDDMAVLGEITTP
ncbi:MAG: glycosyltransferase family 39 protein [Chloroflexi bacterium]|nr:glycosyltransferase family 39 protein [Chloroflexota bacterium]